MSSSGVAPDEVEIDATTGLRAVVATPDSGGPWPGVVVVHDALGMTADLRRQVGWLAGAGYLAVAPDLYRRGGRLRCLFSTLRALSAGEGQAFDDLEAVRSWLVHRDDCTGRVGVIGFCMGGSFAALLAPTGRYGASGINYGDIDDDLLPKLADACPIVASYGARDRSLAEAPARIERVLADHAVPHDVKVYDGAGHGFLNDHAGETPLWALVAGKFANTAYHEPSARDARARILEFFDRHLAEPPGETTR